MLLALDLEHMKYLAKVKICLAIEDGIAPDAQDYEEVFKLANGMLDRFIPWGGYPHNLVGPSGICSINYFSFFP